MPWRQGGGSVRDFRSLAQVVPPDHDYVSEQSGEEVGHVLVRPEVHDDVKCAFGELEGPSSADAMPSRTLPVKPRNLDFWRAEVDSRELRRPHRLKNWLMRIGLNLVDCPWRGELLAQRAVGDSTRVLDQNHL